jgi:Protein of unknown function (DUF1569)
MPTILHDHAVRSSIEKRLRTLSKDSTPRWGKMSVDQMLWHVNQATSVHLGKGDVGSDRPPIPQGILKFMVLRMPWGKGAPTNSAFKAQKPYEFDSELERCFNLIAEFTARPLDAVWPDHPIFGRMSGAEASRLQAKHLDHHLKQFGA